MDYGKQIQAAVDELNTANKKLYRSDGSPKYAPAELEERQSAAKAAFKEKMDAIEASLEEEAQKGQEALEVANAASPLDTLSEAELRRARELQAFLREDIERMSPDELASTARAAKGDKVKAFIFDRYGEPRFQKLMDQYGDRGPNIRESVGLERASKALFELKETLVTPEQQKAIEDAEKAAAEIEGYRARLGREQSLSGAYEDLRVVSVRDL